MKKFYCIAIVGISLTVAPLFTSCSDKDDDEPEKVTTSIIGFKDAPATLFGDSAYGTNLYNGDVSKGYIAYIGGDTYAQFPINYGYNYDAEFNLTWCYTLYNGGLALSKYHDMTEGTYLNQLSVYDTSSPSGGNFVVANGSVPISNPYNAKYEDYDGCARVYLTDQNGYGVTTLGQEAKVSGEDEDGWFKSVWINNTTYTYLTMKNGNDYASSLNEENKGWFKVQFIAFEDNEPNEKPLDYVEAYLANFDESLNIGYIGIIEEWIKVDLSYLPECSILVINFLGSDMGEYGLNTPSYCALDNFEISVDD